jgi:hypothetical protein
MGEKIERASLNPVPKVVGQKPDEKGAPPLIAAGGAGRD